MTFQSECSTALYTSTVLTSSYIDRGFDAGPLAQTISKYTPIPIPYKDPIDWNRWGALALGGVGFLLVLRFISPIIQSRWTWAAITVLTSLVMTSGYMFTRIRNVPFVGNDGNWIAGGYQNQYGQEVQVISFICEYGFSRLRRVT